MASVVFEAVSKHYGHVRAVDGLTLQVYDQEFVVMVGPSGSGKTTALRMVAGLEAADEGVIRIGDRVVNDVPPKDRDIAMMFQSYALYPHMTAYDNIAFGLKMRKTPRAEIEQRVLEAARMLDIERLLQRKPAQLSGGERQRVALGRAMVRQPQVFLMDEPLSNLDAQLRVQTRAEIVKLHRRLKATFIYVTHDQEEAMTVGDRIAVLKDGVLQQYDSPSEIYNRPANLFVARFIGSPAMNLFPRDGYILGIRPEDVHVDNGGNGRATVDVVEHLGSELRVHLSTELGTCLARVKPDMDLKAGQEVPFALDMAKAHRFDRATGKRGQG